MISLRSAIVSLLLSCCFVSSSIHAQETGQVDTSRTVEVLLKKFGKPDQRLDWVGTALDYKLENGQTFTISVSKDGNVWAGLKTDLSSKVGQKIRIRGTYLGPGKEASFVRTEDAQAVYLNLRRKGGMYPTDLEFGDTVTVSGTLEFRPGAKADRADISSLPPLFHIDDPQISQQSVKQTEPRTKR